MTDLDRLDELAAATTGGPWDFADWLTAENHEYIAACDPATIRSLVAAVRERDELRENFTNAAGAVAYAVDRLPPSGSKMTQAAERRMREAVYLMDAALIPAGAALHREDGA